MIFNIITKPHIEVRYDYFTRRLYHSLLDPGLLPPTGAVMPARCRGSGG